MLAEGSPWPAHEGVRHLHGPVGFSPHIFCALPVLPGEVTHLPGALSQADSRDEGPWSLWTPHSQVFCSLGYFVLLPAFPTPLCHNADKKRLKRKT